MNFGDNFDYFRTRSQFDEKKKCMLSCLYDAVFFEGGGGIGGSADSLNHEFNAN